MRDPIEELRELGATEASQRPLPASEVRRLGDRRRRRTHAALTVGAVVAVAAIAVPTAVLTGGADRSAPVDPASRTPSSTATQEPTPSEAAGTATADGRLDDGDLLTAEELPAPYALTPYRELAPYDGATLACQGGWLSELGAEELLSREFGAYSDGAPIKQQPVPSAQVNTAVLRFADADSANAAYATVKGWVASCAPRIDPRWLQAETTGGGTGEGPLGSAERAEWVTGTFCGDSCEGVWFSRTGYARIGDRLLLLQMQAAGGPGMERDPRIWRMDEAMEDMFFAAIQRAAPGTDAQDSDSVDPDAPVPTIPDDFPLAEGWPSPSGADTEIRGPNRRLPALEFEACGTALSDATHDDRVSASYRAPEDFRGRQLTTYPDARAAVAAVREIVQLHRDCPVGEVDEAGYVAATDVRRLDVGGESWAILQRDTFEGGETPFGQTTVLVRLGSAVLVIDLGGHSGYPTGDGSAVVDQAVEEAEAPIAAMCRYTVAGC